MQGIRISRRNIRLPSIAIYRSRSRIKERKNQIFTGIEFLINSIFNILYYTGYRRYGSTGLKKKANLRDGIKGKSKPTFFSTI